MVFGLLAQHYSYAAALNAFFFLHFVHSAIELFASSDQRLLWVGRARTILPSLLIGYFIPTSLCTFNPDLSKRYSIDLLWRYWPVCMSITHWQLSGILNDTTMIDRLNNINADMSSLRVLGGTLLGICAVAFNWMRYKATDKLLLTDIFLLRIESRSSMGDKEAAITILRYEHLMLLLGAGYWLILLFTDLKRARIVTTSWLRLFMCFSIGTMAIGPAATVMAGWMWREQVLATKRHWAAVLS